MAHGVDPTMSWYLTSDPGGMSTINWRKLDQGSESNKASIGETNKVQTRSYKYLKRPVQIIAK